MTHRITWVCKRCAKITETNEGETPEQESRCVTEFALYDWNPVSVK